MNEVDNFQVLTPWEYADVTAMLSSRASIRDFTQTMIWYPGKITDHFAEKMRWTAIHGVDTRLNVASYSLKTTDLRNNFWPWPFGLSKNLEARRLANLAMMESLREAGIKVTVLNTPTLWQKMIPQLGNDHRKMRVVDETAFIMGFNYYDWNFSCIDIAVAVTDPNIVDPLAEQLEHADQDRMSDLEIPCNSETCFLIDGGRVGKSIIYDRAVSLVEEAKHSIRLIGFLEPNGKLRAAMNKVREKGREVEMVVSHPKWEVSAAVLVRLIQRFDNLEARLFSRRLATVFHNPPIHEKTLIIDGQVVMTGSHNFVRQGVWAGTREIDICSTNSTLVRNMRAHYDQVRSQGLIFMG